MEEEVACARAGVIWSVVGHLVCTRAALVVVGNVEALTSIGVVSLVSLTWLHEKYVRAIRVVSDCEVDEEAKAIVGVDAQEEDAADPGGIGRDCEGGGP